MNIKTLTSTLGIALTCIAINAKAQKTINEGVATFSTTIQGQPAEAKQYFKADSSATTISFGPGTVKILTTAKHDYLAVILDIPVAGLKKAGIATPAEIEEGAANYPTFTFTPTTETKQISGFNCKKVTAKDNKSGKTYDIWITNDIVVPPTALPFYYASVGGYPVQYTAFQQGQETTITIKSITDGKAPAGTYAIAPDFEKVGMSDLHP
ncbi:GLPGLI family protein [Mucilaginibacter mallensis]|uniref:GLPGLI family protein n=1 Tax=Mucilaginibacter mallensis TaxID=652787 RepID=A0A1H1Z9Y3_MUCMA|nr:DUF4412 domain-containing protein [Mucilaginibacter mallensis]SDT30498.1 GLPGLI family protein [Mucilaginibacter mallensis]